MDPTNRGPEGYDAGGPDPAHRPAGLPVPGGPPQSRTVQLVSGDFLVTVNPVDGSETELCPPERRPAPPAKYTAVERAELSGAGRATVPPGPALAPLPLLDRQEERGRIVRLLARGRSVRLTGLSGAGRSALLDAVADDCVGFAPDGVVRLNGHRRTARELLGELYRAVYRSDGYRPAPGQLGGHLDGIGAIVLIDDLEFGGDALDEILDATPECAFVVAATPDIPAPSAEAQLEEVFLAGLSRGGSLDLLGRTAGRALTDEEAQWAGDLWFESGGLPIRFVRAGALLRRRSGPDGVPDESAPPLPTVAEVSAPAALLAAGLGQSARAVLRFAVALGGEVPHQAQLPALVDDTHGDAALAELRQCALITPVGVRYRLAHGVQAELAAAGFVTAAEQDELLEAAVRHYGWWAGHQSVASRQILQQADAILAALTGLVARTTAAGTAAGSTAGEVAVKLARAATPAFAAGLDFTAWERALRAGQEAARLSGEVADEAYFHHERGVLALCEGQLDRARAELEASIGLRGALADRRGTVAGRRALALVEDRARAALSGGTPPLGLPAAPTPPAGASGELVPVAPAGPPAPLTPALAAAAAFDEPPAAVAPAADPATLVGAVPAAAATQELPEGKPLKHRRRIRTTRRNLVSAGAGAVLAAVLGTVVTLGATSDKDPGTSDHVGTSPTVSDDDGSGASAADPPQDTTTGTGHPKGKPHKSGSPSPSTSQSASSPADDEAGEGAGESAGGGATSRGGSGSHKPGGPHHSSKPSSKPPSHSSKPPSDPTSPPDSDDPTDPPTSDDPTDPGSPTGDPSDPPDSSGSSDSASSTMTTGVGSLITGSGSPTA